MRAQPGFFSVYPAMLRHIALLAKNIFATRKIAGIHLFSFVGHYMTEQAIVTLENSPAIFTPPWCSIPKSSALLFMYPQILIDATMART